MPRLLVGGDLDVAFFDIIGRANDFGWIECWRDKMALV